MFIYKISFETTATALTHFFYEMAMNYKIQEHLVKVLNEALGENYDHNSTEYYDKVMTNIPYLDAVIKETLRKYPPVVRLTRLASEDTKISGIDIRKGNAVNISVYAVHHDPEFYDEPEKFNPDRFMPENKQKLTPYTYLPFGDGPRNCVGMRFAQQVMKLCIAQIILKFRFSPNDETPKVLEFKKGTMLLSPVRCSISVSKRESL